MVESSQYNEKQLKRHLDTNYKYACLVTLTKQLTRAHKIHKLSNLIAARNRINTEKNYGISCIRLVLLATRQIQEGGLAVADIFRYLQQNSERCLIEKYSASIGIPPSFMQKIKVKLQSDVSVFRRVIEAPLDQEDTIVQLFLGLYLSDQNKPASQRQLKQARKLAKLAIGVAQDPYNFTLNESLLNSTINTTQPLEFQTQVAFNEANVRHSLTAEELPLNFPPISGRQSLQKIQSEEEDPINQSQIFTSVNPQKQFKEMQLQDLTFFQPYLPFDQRFMSEDFQV